MKYPAARVSAHNEEGFIVSTFIWRPKGLRYILNPS